MTLILSDLTHQPSLLGHAAAYEILAINEFFLLGQDKTGG